MEYKLIIDKHAPEAVVVTAHCASALTDQLEALVTGYERTALQGYLDDALYLLSPGQIECITVQRGKSWAICDDGQQYRLKLRLWELEQRLGGDFMRINKSALANPRHIRRFAATYSGGVDAVFGSGYREYVSRRCFAAIKRRLEGK